MVEDTFAMTLVQYYKNCNHSYLRTILITLNKQLRMLMVTVYIADGLRALLMNVKMFAEAFQHILIKGM